MRMRLSRVGAFRSEEIGAWARCHLEPGTVVVSDALGLRRQHLQSCLDEFVFRFNRRRSRHAAFPSILRIGLEIKPATYKMLIEPELKGQALARVHELWEK